MLHCKGSIALQFIDISTQPGSDRCLSTHINAMELIMKCTGGDNDTEFHAASYELSLVIIEGRCGKKRGRKIVLVWESKRWQGWILLVIFMIWRVL